jgi:hypothetical protein
MPSPNQQIEAAKLHLIYCHKTFIDKNIQASQMQVKIVSYRIDHIIPYQRSFPSIPSLLLPTQRILHTASHRTVRIEVLANHAVARKRSTDLLTDAADGAVLGESTADSALCVERCGGFVVGGVLAAGKRVLV